jgi:hypothetical protein
VQFTNPRHGQAPSSPWQQPLADPAAAYSASFTRPPAAARLLLLQLLLATALMETLAAPMERLGACTLLGATALRLAAGTARVSDP